MRLLNIRTCLLIVLVILLTKVSIGQLVIQKEISSKEMIKLTNSVTIPPIKAGYTLILPEDSKPIGMMIFFNSGRDTSSAGFEMRVYPYAIRYDLAVMFVTTANRLDFFFNDESIAEVDGYITEVIKEYGISKDELLYGGMSLAGTRAIKYALYCRQGRSRLVEKPLAIAVCDAPLDFMRFWKSGKQAEKLGFHPASSGEGAWVTDHLEMNLGGTPIENEEAYMTYSPYTYSMESSSKTEFLKNIAIRAYTEPDVLWWMETRRKDYYGFNSIDAAGFVNELNIAGNDEAELIITSNKGHHPDGSKHPHSWSIVDNKELVDWFIKLLNDR